MPRKAQPSTVVEAVERDLSDLGDPALARSSLAFSALSLARELDDDRNSATSKSMCAKALLDVMNRIRELAPPKAEKDALDELRMRRDSRRSG